MASRFEMAVVTGGETDTLRVEAEDLKAGWNVLGRYRFEEGELASVELSDRANGRLYADAVRWRYVDPDRPDEVYEEALPRFEWGSTGGRGNRGGGRRGGGRSNW